MRIGVKQFKIMNSLFNFFSNIISLYLKKSKAEKQSYLKNSPFIGLHFVKKADKSQPFSLGRDSQRLSVGASISEGEHRRLKLLSKINI